jgi:hypothetical protein
MYLELLDEITELHYESKLPNTIIGDRRNDLIYSYRLHKGIEYVPPCMHDSIKWSKSNPMLEPIDTNIEWEILTHSKIKRRLMTKIYSQIHRNIIEKMIISL